jgi:hypothetical protein
MRGAHRSPAICDERTAPDGAAWLDFAQCAGPARMMLAGLAVVAVGAVVVRSLLRGIGRAGLRVVDAGAGVVDR